MIAHPSTYIDTDLVTTLRNTAAAAEGFKKLHPEQMNIIYEQRWLQLFVPEQYDGLEFDLPAALQLEEALAWVDGSVGWTVTLCAGAAWFVGFLDPVMAAAIFNDKKVCIAGSGKASGIAKKTGDEYIVTGLWDYASGADYATAFTANCMIEENGRLLQNEDGSTLIYPFLFLRDEVIIHTNWKPIGMIATGSNRFETKELKVDKNRAFIIQSRHAVLKQPVFQYPFLQFAETTLAVNSSGMALRFLELCSTIFNENAHHVLPLLKTIVNDLAATRQKFYAIVADSWKACVANNSINTEVLEQLSIVSRQLAVASRKAVDELYPYCGMKAADPATEINRVWRNLHTASQHSLFNR